MRRSYQQFSEMFGCSKREATNAITRLEKIGVLKRHFRTISSEEFVANNVLFIELIPSKLEELAFTPKVCDPIPLTIPTPMKCEGLPFKRDTNIENTNKNIKRERKEESGHSSQQVKSDKKENLDSIQVSDSEINLKLLILTVNW